MTALNRVVLFDLGGVLADLGNPATSMRLDKSLDEFWSAWLSSPRVHEFETGQHTITEFSTLIAPELGLTGPDFEAQFRQWVLQPFPGINELVAYAKQSHRVGLLSNTNELHWQQVTSSTNAFDAFDKLFLSFETGNFKPGESAYQQVVRQFDCDAVDVLFLDDSPRNVDAAIEFGMTAEVVNGPAEAKAAIRSWNPSEECADQQ